MSNVKVTVLTELCKTLENISKEVECLSKQQSIPFDDVITNTFMTENTPYNDFDEFLKGGGFSINSQNDFDSIDQSEFDSFVSSVTNFSGFQEMIDFAGRKYFENRFKNLGFK
ncbi:MAG: hypothetical protein CVU92_04725 [Firmicutes bacterium HGW-Firmicutes-17]|jgi:hypothetical protein|nr:MAG: hypothetical protein CVU92_04725 [Firmicutes bacterium HGW-Firmicutes-17]